MLFSESLRFDSRLCLWTRLSQLVIAVDTLLDVYEDEEGDRTGMASVGVVKELKMFVRLVMLPMRRRGTRVCIFCSRFLTLARISDTICTPLFFDAVLLDDAALGTRALRVTVRDVGVLGIALESYKEVAVDRAKAALGDAIILGLIGKRMVACSSR